MLHNHLVGISSLNKLSSHKASPNRKKNVPQSEFSRQFASPNCPILKFVRAERDTRSSHHRSSPASSINTPLLGRAQFWYFMQIKLLLKLPCADEPLLLSERTISEKTLSAWKMRKIVGFKNTTWTTHKKTTPKLIITCDREKEVINPQTEIVHLEKTTSTDSRNESRLNQPTSVWQKLVEWRRYMVGHKQVMWPPMGVEWRLTFH